MKDILGRRIAKIKTYFKDIHQRFSLINCLLWSTLLSLIFLFIDKNNILSDYIGNLENPVIITVFIMLFGILLFIKLNITELMKYTFVDFLDKTLIILLGITFIIQVLFFITYENMLKDTWINLLVMLIVSLLIYNRASIIALDKSVFESSVIDLKEILEEKYTTDKPFLVRESEVDYDLLSRDILINDLVNWIKNYQSNERFVVGIEGEWGSGKSTLIKNIISKIKSDDNTNEFIIIDDFEPWISENKVSLLDNLFNRILRNPQLKITDEDVTQIIDTFMNLIFGRKFSIDFKFWKKDTEYSAGQIIENINKVLAGKNQKIIFIIDNLDRISSDHILLLFNIIQNVLNFNNLIIILSYDKYEIESVLQKRNISSGYLDKLVQKKIVLSPPNENLLLNIYIQAFESLASEFSFTNYKIDEIQHFFQVLVNNNKLDMREFKRLLNSAIIPILSADTKKYLLDELVIEYIKFSNFTLYNKILVNYEYFISVDRGMSSSFSFLEDNTVDTLFNKFYEKLENRYIKGEYELKILALIFPNINKYSKDQKHNYKNAVNSVRTNSEYIDSQKNKRIFSGKFFDLYFTLGSNYSGNIIDSIEMSIIGLENNLITVSKIIDGVMEYPANAQYDFFENFEYYIEEFENNELKQFVAELLNRYFKFKSNWVFFRLDIDERIAVVVTRILEKLDFKDYCEIILIYLEKPRFLSVINRVIYWLDKSYTTDNTEKLEFTKIKHENYIEKLFSSESINIFDLKYYSKGNAMPIMNYAKEKDDLSYKNYINQKLNKETVFRIINDFIGRSIDSTNTYHLISNVEEYIDFKVLEEILFNTVPNNEKEEFIKEVFKKYLAEETDDFGTPAGVKTTEFIDLRFI